MDCNIFAVSTKPGIGLMYQTLVPTCSIRLFHTLDVVHDIHGHYFMAGFVIDLVYVGSPEFPVTSLMTKHCCDRKEVTSFKFLSQADIEHIREQFYSSTTETEQTQHLLNYVKEHSQRDKSVLYTVAGQKVCEDCFRMVYGIYNRFTSVKAKFVSGVVVAEHGRLGKSHIGDASIRVISWLCTFVQKVGDRMPSSSDIHLPSCLTKADIYALAADDLCQGGLKCCNMSTFYAIWKSEFPHVKIPKVKKITTNNLVSQMLCCLLHAEF